MQDIFGYILPVEHFFESIDLNRANEFAFALPVRRWNFCDQQKDKSN
jgi:hypothetical protein